MTDQEFDQLFDNGESILETLDLSTAHRINCPTDPMTNPYHAMCAELVDAYEHELNKRGMGCDLINRARALLDQPVAEGPTIAELWELYEEMADEPGDWAWVRDYALAVLAKWGHPTPQPVAEEPTIPSSTLHRQELTPSEVTLLNTFWRSR